MSTADFPTGGGEMGARVRAHDWSASPLGPIDQWPQSLKTLVDLVLAAALPTNLLWGPALIQIYNDAYVPILRTKHPAGLGQPAAECWPEVWDLAAPLYERVFAGETVTLQDRRWTLLRNSRLEEGYFSAWLIPVRDEAGVVAGAHVTTVETTERVMAAPERDRAEQVLRESEERFRQFAEHVRDVLWIFDAEASRMEYLSPAYERVWGEPRDAILRDWNRRAETIHPDDRKQALDAFERVLRGEEILPQEYRIVRADGTVRWIRDTFFPIRDEHGRVRRVAGVAQDITTHSESLVYVVDADEASRRDVSLLLQGAGYAVTGFASARAFLDMAPALVPGCVLVDIRMPEAGDFMVPQEIKARRIPLPVIITGHDGLAQVRVAVQAVKAGAADFLEMPYTRETLLTTIASALVDIRDKAEHDLAAELARARIADLSTRERDVLDGLLAGGTNKTIAKELELSPRTVEVHRGRLMQRLSVRTLPEAVLMAVAGGLRLPTRHHEGSE